MCKATTIKPARTALVLAMSTAFALAANQATAQADQDALQAGPATPVARVEITGSSIKRVDAETALPVQVLRREDIDRSGVTTAAELLSKISASAAGLTDGSSFTDLPGQRGFNGANLRGVGVSSTLVARAVLANSRAL